VQIARELVEQLRLVVERADAGEASIYLDAERLAAFLRWSKLERRNSPKWVKDQKRYLGWWRDQLEGHDLRTLPVVLVKGRLRRQKSSAHRIAVLKRFVSWLVVEDGTLSDDPLRSLHVPQARPAQWRRSKVVDLVDIHAVRRRLSVRYRDALDVLRGTCWHLTELERFARRGCIREPLPMERRDLRRLPGSRVAGVLQTTHKTGRIFLTAVSVRTLRAARRVRSRGGICISHFAGAIRRECGELGLHVWSPGQLRHTGASFALARGATLGQIADFLGHLDPRTTRRWYAVHVAAAKVPTLL